MTEIVVTSPLKISILIPCYNEEKTIEKCVLSCLDQISPAYEIIVVDDHSFDRSPEILEKFRNKIKIVRAPVRLGNKSHAQELGMQYVSGDILVVTDGDTLVSRNFLTEVQKTFQNSDVSAMAGYVSSQNINWLTTCRALDYLIGQNVHKLAQSHLGFLFVIPGAAGAFRLRHVAKYFHFDHDTVTEDLDLTFKLHRDNLKIVYNTQAVVTTQDPTDLHGYVNQMRRWFGGGWQNLRKHLDIVTTPSRVLELSIMYSEGLIFSLLIFLVPLINLKIAAIGLLISLIYAYIFAVYGSIKLKRTDLLVAPLFYVFIMYVNAYIFIEQFIQQIVLGRKIEFWFKPERVAA